MVTRKGSSGNVVGSANLKVTPVQQQISKLPKQAVTANVANFANRKTANLFQSAGPGSNTLSDINFLAPDYYHPELQPDQLLLPKSRREKNLWIRHFYENDPVVGSCIDFHTEVPISMIRLVTPDCKDHDKAKDILRFYEDKVVEKLELLDRLLEFSHEFHLFGVVHPFLEWDDEQKIWTNIIILDPNDVITRKFPFSNNVEMELQVPPDIINILNNPDPRFADIVANIPSEILEFVRHGKNLPLDTNPYAGSHISQIARRRSPYRNLGTAQIERVFKNLVYKDRLQNAQQAIADRNMSPKHLITAVDVNEDSLDNLREQVEFSLSDPDFAIIANYDVNWNLIGANERLLQIQGDLDYCDKQIMTGMGLTESLITGEGTFGGNYMNINIINERYLLFRSQLTNWVENHVFKPIAYHNEFYEDDGRGNRRLIYPKLQFNRLNLRDNTEAFGNLFNLYSKGSLDVSTILEMFHIDPIEVKRRLEKDMFTVNDPVFNDLIRSIYSELGRNMVGETDLLDKIAKYMRLRLKPEEPEPGAGPGEGGL